jgi:hypothetical protein
MAGVSKATVQCLWAANDIKPTRREPSNCPRTSILRRFRVGAQILIPGMPLLIELTALFDALIVVSCFGVLVRYLQDRCGRDHYSRGEQAGGIA